MNQKPDFEEVSEPTPKPKKTKRLIIYVTEDLHAAARRRVAQLGMSITDYGEALFSKSLGRN